jgi:hypothetical protein
MECPKCGGGAYLAEEDLIQVLESTDPVKLMLRATYQCRACSERFTRVIYDDITARKKEMGSGSPPVPSPYAGSESDAQGYPSKTNDEGNAAEGLKFF